MRDREELRRMLRRIDRRGYKAYRDIEGAFDLGDCRLYVDHVQADPFAAPSRVRVRVPESVARVPAELWAGRVRRIALEDFLARRVREAILGAGPGRRGSGKSGHVGIDAGGQQVIERTALAITGDWVEARLEVGLPAAGRSVLGGEAEELLCEALPRIAARSLRWSALAMERARDFVACVENQEAIRGELCGRGLVAFVADGALLPRQSGASDLPLARERAQPFRSPDSLRVSFELPNPVAPQADASRTVAGMGIPRGVTLIVGGGYHGKSTLLVALERAVYPHVPGDGRELVVTDADAVKIRAEDGRGVSGVDISAFIGTLPGGRSTERFSSEDASGSTSQAANIAEALESGASALLLDEDTSATNFMVRDARMQALVHKRNEPITPFVERVRELHERLGVSTVLVMGGCGDYFEAADTVIRMREYRPEDATREAREVARRIPSTRRSEAPAPLPPPRPRVPLASGFDPSRGRRAVKIDARGRDEIAFGRNRIDLRAVEQIVDPSQTRAIGAALHRASSAFMDGSTTLAGVLDRLERELLENGLAALSPFGPGERHPGNLARPRRHEIAAAINRLRTLRVRWEADPRGAGATPGAGG